ncbi:MAG TPA: efflux RND transporter periplasmic adaptor subunit [Thermoanaerobaculia bacterium]|nr:efflux RND transporter periplasmic adaptor subunit [Thermoanaerobaculia bacterium]
MIVSARAWRLTAVLAAGLALAGAGCSKDEANAAGGGPGSRGAIEFPVEVIPVSSQRVTYTITSVGSIEAFERVEVTARVAGAIERVRFSEGQLVDAGEVLVEIEPERYRIAVDSAQANFERAVAEQAEAEAGLERRRAANETNPGLIRGEEIATWQTRVQTAAAEVSQARAALRQAELNLRDAFVRAPVRGIVQTRTVQTGQYVPVGTVLATMVRRDPLLLRFQVPEQDAGPIGVGQRVSFAVGEIGQPYGAVVTHVAASADRTSRMVEITARIDDPRQEALTPGGFARVTIPIGATEAAPVIPQTAIRPSEKGFLAFVVEDGVARERTLTLGMRTPEGAVEVRSGLSAGERLVIRGAEALRDGASVRVTEGSWEPMTIRPLDAAGTSDS